jgi:hypothetical protein
MMHETQHARSANNRLRNGGNATSHSRALSRSRDDRRDHLHGVAMREPITPGLAANSRNFASVPAFLQEQPITRSSPNVLQKKLAIGRADDPLEHEADRVADQVMRMSDPQVSVASAPPQLSRKCDACEEEEEKLRKKSAGPQGAGAAPAIVQQVLGEPGRPLDRSTREFFEPRFGYDFSSVRLHAGTRAADSARAVGALAYTVGEHVVLPKGEAGPSALLAHELVHVAQAGKAPRQLRAKRGDAANVAAPMAPPSAEPMKLRRVLGVGCCEKMQGMRSSHFEVGGNFEHALIENDYVSRFSPSAERECGLPESTATGSAGWADIVDPPRRQIFEIKPDNPAGVRQAVNEAAYYVMSADEFCTGRWKEGTNYFEHAIHDDGEQQLWARLAEPGAIVYRWRVRQRSHQSEWVRLLLLAAALAAAALAKAAKAGMKAGEKDAGGPITAVVTILAALAVLVLGEREAKAGTKRTDDDPLVALADVLSDTGMPMPPEIQKLLDEHPELEQLVRIEMERRRRSGAKTLPDAKPGSAGAGAVSPPSQTTPGAASGTSAAGGAAATKPAASGASSGPAVSAGDKQAPEPKTPSPSSGAKDETKEPAASAAGGKSYWQSAREALDQLDISSLANNKAKININLAALSEGQVATAWCFQRSGATKSAWLVQFKVIKQDSASTTIQILFCGQILARTEGGGDRQLPAPAAYAVGKTIVSRDEK